MSYDDALAVQRRHESELLRLPGVSAAGVKRRDDHFVLEVSVDPDAQLPDELTVPDLEGLPLEVARRRYELH